MAGLNTPPVAFLVFARPATTAKVWAAIRRARPKRLLVVADAARAGRTEEAGRVAEVRRLIRPDWPCKVQRLYADENMGCGRRISSGLDWVFSQVPEAVILEDDCLPGRDFFRWTAAMLERHRDDETVMSVAGSVAEGADAPAAHRSRYPFIWGWASWRRAWRHYDRSMRAWPALARGAWLEGILPNRAACRFWGENFWDVHDGRIDTWDYQWIFACWKQQGSCLVPPVNLISNIGLEHATHPTEQMRNVGLPLRRLRRFEAPQAGLGADKAWDDAFERMHYSGYQPVPWRRVLKRHLRPLLDRIAGGIWR